MKVTNSMIKSYQRCHRQYAYKFLKQIVPKQTALPLKRGSWLHELLQAKYEGKDWKEVHNALTTQFNALFEEEREFYGNLPAACGHIMESYDYHWREEDEKLEIIEVEMEFEVPMPHGHILGGQVDAIVEDEWGLWLMEHKSHKKIPDADYRFLDIQTARYVWALRKLGYNITGVLWNYMSTVEPKKPKLVGLKEKNGPRLSRAKVNTDLFTFVDAIREYGLDPHLYKDDILRLKQHNRFLRRERVPKPKVVVDRLVREAIFTADEIERGVTPVRSIERSCEYMCPYLNICTTSLYGGDVTEMLKGFQKATKKDYYAYAENPQDQQ